MRAILALLIDQRFSLWDFICYGMAFVYMGAYMQITGGEFSPWVLGFVFIGFIGSNLGKYFILMAGYILYGAPDDKDSDNT